MSISPQFFGPVLFIGIIAGCGSNKDTPSPSTSSSIATSTNGVAAPPVAQGDPGALAEKTLASWVEAQNNGQFDAYTALYDKSFNGIRRTGDGAEKTFNLDGWIADRKRLFSKKQQIAADQVTKKVDGDRVTLKFIQRWKSGTAADHGEKVIELRQTDGGMRIVREEMKWSERGWEDSKDRPFDATTLIAPITMTVEKIRLPDNGDCSVHQLRIRFEDAQGNKKELTYGSITGMGGAASSPSGKLAPKNGEYTDLGTYCAGLQAGHTMKVSGDTLVALDIWNDEESGPGKNNKVVAKLPPGAKVILQ